MRASASANTFSVTAMDLSPFHAQVANLAGKAVGIKQVSDNIWLLSFMGYDLGYFDNETSRLEPLVTDLSPRMALFSHLKWRSERGDGALVAAFLARPPLAWAAPSGQPPKPGRARAPRGG